VFPNLGSSEQQAALIVGFFLPLVLAIPMQPHWPNSLRTIFAVAAYAAAGAIIAAAGGHFTGKSVWQVTLEVLTLGVIGYQGVWKPSGLAPTIENATTTKQPAAVASGGSPPPGPPSGSAAAGTTAGSAAAGTEPRAGGSSLDPQIVQLLAASVRLLEHATRQIAATPTSPAAGAAPSAESSAANGANGDSLSAVREAAEAMEPPEVVDRNEGTARETVDGSFDRPAGPPLR
jgi:hypothetical protein